MDLENRISWNPIWDNLFRSRAWGRYPSEELVALVSRSFGAVPDRSAVKLLDLGCGPGANVWFMAREGYQVSGIDGSKVAIDRAAERLTSEGLHADLHVGDLVNLPFENATFNAVFDIAAIQHNLRQDRESAVAEANRVLIPGGIMFSILVGHGSWGEGTGRNLEPGTYEDIEEGTGVGGGSLHFFEEAELPCLFWDFSDLTYERRTRTRDNRTKEVVHWIAVATKSSNTPKATNNV